MFDKEELDYLKEMEERILKRSGEMTKAIIEGYCEPRFQMLADGHKAILDTTAPKTRVDALADEVVLLKQVVRMMSQDIAELKKAQ